MRRRPALAAFIIATSALCAAVVHAGEIAPLETRRPAVGPAGNERGLFSPRTLSVAVEVDRDSARILSYTLKRRPFLAPLQAHEPRAAVPGRSVQLEVVLRGPGKRRFTRRETLEPICFEHGPGTPPHVEGDTMRLHRDVLLLELPEIDGFDRIEVAYYESYRGERARRELGADRLDRARFDPAGGGYRYADLTFADERDSSDRASRASRASTALWPEDFDDTEIYQIFGDPADGDRRLNVVIVPDGYRYAQKALMEQHASGLVNLLRQKTPFEEHDPFINYTLVYAYSVDSGTDQCDCDLIRDTAMGTRFPEVQDQCGHFDNRCVYYGGGCDDSGLDNIVAAEQRAPFHDETIIMVNSSRFGGCGGLRSVYTAAHGSGNAVGSHELGHSVAGLADEYVTNTGCGTYAGEINTSLDAVEGAWPEWIAELGPPREGARYWSECIFRSENTCTMRSSGNAYCAVCNQRWALFIFGHPRISPTAPIESISTAPEQVVVDSEADFSVTPRLAEGPGVTNSFRWTIVGPGGPEPPILASASASYTHRFEELGDYTVSCEVVADTNFVKPSRYGANRDVATWEIEAVATICEVGCADGIPECDADGDGLGDICDPCPGEPLNGCFGPAATDNTALVALRVNTDSTSTESCSGDKLDCRGKLWLADFGAPESATGYNQPGLPLTCDLDNDCPIDVAGLFGCADTMTEDLFRCGQSDPSDPPDLVYTFDVPDGDYLVNLLLTNTTSATSEPGERVFSVKVNDEVPPQLTGFDPVVAAGGPCDPNEQPCPAVSRSVMLDVTGGTGLKLEFLGEVERPIVQGIEVLCSLATWYGDMDEDGFGDPLVSTEACYRPAGFVADDSDCDDGDAAIHPQAEEICDGVDNNCDDAIDEDVDGDGVGVCDDCDDANPAVWAVPQNVLNLVFESPTRLTWDPPADAGGTTPRYTVLRTEDASDFTIAQCLLAVGSLGGTSFNEQAEPDPGVGYYYLVRAGNSCGSGPLGAGSDGVPRQGPTCGFSDPRSKAGPRDNEGLVTPLLRRKLPSAEGSQTIG